MLQAISPAGEQKTVLGNTVAQRQIRASVCRKIPQGFPWQRECGDEIYSPLLPCALQWSVTSSQPSLHAKAEM